MTGEVFIPAIFDLAQTLDCGQAFRWQETVEEDGSVIWEGAAGSRFLRIKKEGEFLRLSCTPEEYDSFWREYFDMGSDYDKKRARLCTLSPVLRQAVEFAPGIRILRQDPWEALCSFIISQNNHIPRIKGIIQRLCESFGAPIPGSELFSFPSPHALAPLSVEDLAPLRAGFRAKYLLDGARKIVSGQVNLKEIARSPVEFGRSELQKISGVGPKVAECALLYGFHKTECFPMDVWMKRAMEKLLPGHEPQEFGKDAGIAQQYLFHYSRLHPELFR